MEMNPDISFLDTLLRHGLIALFLFVFTGVTTIYLFIRRIFLSSRGVKAYDLRDYLMLGIGPIISLLYYFHSAGLAIFILKDGCVDSGYPLTYKLFDASSYVLLGACCFSLGVVAILWPVAKTPPASALR